MTRYARHESPLERFLLDPGAALGHALAHLHDVVGSHLYFAPAVAALVAALIGARLALIRLRERRLRRGRPARPDRRPARGRP
jgi:hypothetical protein